MYFKQCEVCSKGVHSCLQNSFVLHISVDLLPDLKATKQALYLANNIFLVKLHFKVDL